MLEDGPEGQQPEPRIQALEPSLAKTPTEFLAALKTKRQRRRGRPLPSKLSLEVGTRPTGGESGTTAPPPAGAQ